MLEIVIKSKEYFNEKTNTFEYTTGGLLLLEHSLSSLYDWESKWKKPFMSKTPKTNDELIDYIKIMTLNKSDINDDIYKFLTMENIRQISYYMEDTMTATTIKDSLSPSRKIVTAEVIYSWMTTLNIPFECQYWHLNRLLMLIRVCNEMQKPPKKMSKADTMRQNTALNKARRARKH